MCRFQTLVTVSDDFRSLIKSHCYERLVLTIINKSSEIFNDITFSHIENQSHGECDFEDNCGRKYDAKLVFNERQGQLIGDPRNNFKRWLQCMTDEKTEFSDSIERRDTSLVTNTVLYQVMRDRLKSVKRDETAILFIPFPVVDDSRDSIFLQHATDFLQAVYERLVEDELVRCSGVYFIYPSMEPDVYVLRDDKRTREYIRCEELRKYISFETRLVSD